MNNRPCVNGILAAVLSASVLPIHGALAKSPTAPKNAAKNAVKKPAKPQTPEEGQAKSDADAAAEK